MSEVEEGQTTLLQYDEQKKQRDTQPVKAIVYIAEWEIKGSA